MVIAGIYIDKSFNTPEEATEFGVFLGGQSTTWFAPGEEPVHDFHEIIEHGGLHNLKEISGYSFGINKQKKEWHVRDTGHKQCKHILFKGKYEGDHFEQQISKFIKQMTGV